MIRNLLLAGSLAATLFFINQADLFQSPKDIQSRYEKIVISENKAPEYYVKFLLVTPCINGVECFDFNEEILQGAADYYKEYGITIEFERTYIEVAEDISIDLSSHVSPSVGLELKLELIRATETEMPFILHAPMFVGARPKDPGYYTLGVAQQYTQLIVLKQGMIESESTAIEEHVLIHEIGHIFGLLDIYDENSCNTMDGIVDYKTLYCQKLTPEQVNHMKQVIKSTLM